MAAAARARTTFCRRISRKATIGGNVRGAPASISRTVRYPSVKGTPPCSISLIVVILLVIFLLGGFSGRFGGYGYGYGHGGMGIIGVILVIIVILMLLGRI